MALTGDDKQWISEQLTALRIGAAENLERVETNLLTEFHKWASPIDAGLRSNSAALRTIDADAELTSSTLQEVRERIKVLEERARRRDAGEKPE